ncbi:MAG: hypothetical protein KatS3mg031_2836 [Chitinophagales bacterium]|nr:MAG: hypothetical protein KatS3mg031_2836 [Chitinophagales bacterium]
MEKDDFKEIVKLSSILDKLSSPSLQPYIEHMVEREIINAFNEIEKRFGKQICINCLEDVMQFDCGICEDTWDIKVTVLVVQDGIDACHRHGHLPMGSSRVSRLSKDLALRITKNTLRDSEKITLNIFAKLLKYYRKYAGEADYAPNPKDVWQWVHRVVLYYGLY